MKGLLLKEYYVMKRYNKIYLLYILIFGGTAVFTGNIGFFGSMSVVFMSTIPLSSFSHDDFAHWDRMVAASPVSRNAVVQSKYLIALIMFAVATLLSGGVLLLGKLMRPELVNLSQDGLGVLTAALVMGMMMMVILPFIFKLGAEKGRIAMMLIFGGIFALILLMGALLENSGISGNASDAVKLSITMVVLVVLPLVLAVVSFVSYKISCGIYAKKEL
ncbi:MAG: ABC-2 transporter permease [Angelakisella sp.]